MRLLAWILVALALVACPAKAQTPQAQLCSSATQSTPQFSYGYVPSAASWNNYFGCKQDQLGFAPLNKAGDIMSGKLILPPSLISTAPFNIPQGSTPNSPTNGDIWITSSGVAAQVNGQTITLGAPGGVGLPGGSTNSIQYNNNGVFGGFSITGDCVVTVPSGAIVCSSFNGGTAFGTAAGQNLSYPISPSLGGTGVNNSSFTITLLENLSATGGFSLQLNTSGVTDANFPSGTHTVASTDGTGQSISGGATVPTGNTQIATGNFTVNSGNGPLQWQLNCGNWTITAPSAADGTVLIVVINACGTSTPIGNPTLNGFMPLAGAGFTYANTPTQSSVSVTVTSASPGVVTWTSHGMKANSPVYFTSSGAMPGGINQYQVYYVVGSSVTTNTFQISATPNGTAINTSTTGSSVLGFEPSVWALSVQTVQGMSNYNWLPWQ